MKGTLKSTICPFILTWSQCCQSAGIFASPLPSTGSTSSLLLVQVTDSGPRLVRLLGVIEEPHGNKGISEMYRVGNDRRPSQSSVTLPRENRV